MGNATHSTSFTVREHRIAQLEESLEYIREVETRSMGELAIVRKDKSFVISWRLMFDFSSMVFHPCASLRSLVGALHIDDYRLIPKVKAALSTADIPFEDLDMRDWVPELRQE
jgi:hypothetical protein